MAPEQKRADALQLIFSFFLGILLAVLIGAGVWTFYPDPYGANSPEQEQLEELYKQQERLNTKTVGAPTPAQQVEQRRIQDEIDKINDDMTDGRSTWAINTSIVLITFATVLMAISLFLPEHLRVFSNGVLLGGLLTVLYGTGWSFAGGNSRARFFVILVAVLLAVVFGYLRFIRGRQRAEATRAAAAVVATEGGQAPLTAESAEGLVALTARVQALEARAVAAAEALRGEQR